MKRYPAIFLCLLLCGIHALAQKTFSGTYITNEGEKIAVTFPNFRQWAHNPSQVKVRTTEGKELILTPASAHSFTVDGYETYVSRRFTRLLNPIDEPSNNVELLNRDSLEEVQGFLLLVTEGAGVKLYKYSDKQRENFYVEKDSLQELRYKIYRNDANNLVHDADYREQLRILFSDRITVEPKLGNELSYLEYKETPIRKLIEKALGISNKKKRNYPSEFMVMAGAAYNTFDVSSKVYDDLGSVTADYGPTVSPVIGIGFIGYSQRNFAKNFITAQAKYYSFKNSGSYTKYDEERDVTFQASVINLSVGVGRNLVQTPQTSWYAAVAINGSYLPNSRENFNYESSIRYLGAPMKVSIFTQNIVLQTGVRHKNGFGMWLHYNMLPTETKQVIHFRHEHRTIQFGAEWRLKDII